MAFVRLFATCLVLLAAAGDAQILGWGIRTKFKAFLKEAGVLQCGYVKDAVKVLDSDETGLRSRVLSQDWAVKTIIDAFDAQQPHAAADSNQLQPPMFLFFVGPTGVGKTFTAVTIAELIHDTDRDAILLRGENYNNPNVSIGEYHLQIQTLLQQKLNLCKGRSVVIFDEIQKVAPQTLDIFSTILEHGQFEFFSADGKLQKVNCHGTVFIFISDLGKLQIMEAAILEADNELNMRRRAKDAIVNILGEEAETVGLLRNVKTIVPFAPLRHADIEKILKMQLNAMLESGDGTWKNVTFGPNYFKYLSAPPHVSYLEYDAVVSSDTAASPHAQSEQMSADFAEYGARKVSVPVGIVRSKLNRLHRTKVKLPAHYHFSLIADSRCDVDGLPHYMTEIKACTKKDDQCLEDGIDAWEVVFSGDFEHG